MRVWVRACVRACMRAPRPLGGEVGEPHLSLNLCAAIMRTRQHLTQSRDRLEVTERCIRREQPLARRFTDSTSGVARPPRALATAGARLAHACTRAHTHARMHARECARWPCSGAWGFRSRVREDKRGSAQARAGGEQRWGSMASCLRGPAERSAQSLSARARHRERPAASNWSASHSRAAGEGEPLARASHSRKASLSAPSPLGPARCSRAGAHLGSAVRHGVTRGPWAMCARQRRRLQ